MTNDESNPKSETRNPGSLRARYPARRWIRPRVVAILLVLLAAICGSVILADVLSPRDRQAVPETLPAATGSTP